MTDNLSKRIFTSLILLSVLLTCLFLSKYLWLILVIIASVISFLEFNNLLNKIWKKKEFFKYFIKIICLFYLLFFINSANEIYERGLIPIIFILLICIFSDTGGYIVGKIIGGKKLTKISPNKTISGTIGSFIFSLIPIIIFLIIYEVTKNNDFKIYSYVTLIILCLSLSFISQLGDLFISYFKRKAKVKDTGSILPGHGGILDRIDGIVFAVPGALIIDKIIILYS